MDLSLTDEQRLLRDTAARFFRDASPLERVRAAEPLGFDAGLWQGVVELGLPLLADEHGLIDRCLVCAEAGRHLAPVPLIETLAARRLVPTPPPAEAMLAFAPRPAVDGRWEMVPAGAIATAVVGIDGDRLLLVHSGRPRRDRPMSNLGCAPLAHRSTSNGRTTLLAEGAEAHRRFRAVRDEWRVMTAAALVGLAERALDIAVGHVTQREQFGVPIATFQTVAHRLADLATAVDGARLLVHKAAWAHDEGDAGAPTLAAMAFLFAAETAERAAGDSLHLHGGYGFTLEYDIQLFYRRAKAWPLVAGSPRREIQDLAAALVAAPEA